MSKKQTAMMEFMEYMIALSNTHPLNTDYQDSLLNKCVELLPKERHQIIDAHGIKLKKSIEQGVDVWEQTTGEQYFTETYGTK